MARRFNRSALPRPCDANEQDMPGFKLGQKIEGKCGMRASMTAELVFDGVEASSIQSITIP